MGHKALYSLNGAHYNTAFGKSALESLTTGYGNVAVGSKAGDSITSSNYNTCVGHEAGKNPTTADNNTCIGAFAGKSITSSGVANTIVGREAASSLTSGHRNIVVGYYSGYNLTTGTLNILIGRDAGTAISPGGSITTGSYNLVLGDNTLQNFYCADTSISSSDQRDKTDVTDFTKGLEWIEALRPVTYRWDRRTWYGTDKEPYGTPDGSKKRQRLHIGFLAQEALAVEQANGYGTSNDDSLILNLTDDGMSYGMKYERLVPILVNAIKELSNRVKALEAG